MKSLIRKLFGITCSLFTITTAMQTDSLPFMQLGYGELYGDAAVSPDGKYLLTGTYIQRAILIELETGRVVQMYPAGHVESCDLSPDGKTVVTSSVGGIPRLFDTQTGELTGTLSGHTAAVSSVRFSPDGSKILTASSDSTARLWDAGTREQIRTFSGLNGWVRSAVFSPDGRTICAGGNNFNSTVRLWSAATGDSILTTAFKGGTSFVSYSPDGTKIIVAGAKSVYLYNAATGVYCYRISSVKRQCVAFRGKIVVH